jgi:hypothetical protein
MWVCVSGCGSVYKNVFVCVGVYLCGCVSGVVCV